jgi:hypothetical protein
MSSRRRTSSPTGALRTTTPQTARFCVPTCTLYDLDLLGIEPDTLIVRVHPDAKAAEYGGFDGVKLKCSSSEPSREALTLRWEAFLRRGQ